MWIEENNSLDKSWSEIDQIKNPDQDKPDLDKPNSVNHLNIFNRIGFVDSSTEFSRGPRRRDGFKLAVWMWMSLVIDGLILFAVTSLVIMASLFIIKQNYKDSLSFLVTGDNLKMSFIVVFLFLGWMYFISTRTIVGASIGEWTCKLRLGQPHERAQDYYLSRIVMRSTLTLLTGLVVLPILSLILKKDIIGKITGIYIYSLK